ncbi:MAG: MucB/RseB C-terminal domain-containing protein [Pseudomonadota bacterium]
MFAWLILIAPASLADASPNEWLQRMNLAFEQQDYDGRFSFFSGSHLASLRVVHKVIDGVTYERLVHLNGAPREIVREGEQVLCILEPGDKLASMSGSIPAGPFARAFVRDLTQVSKQYRLSLHGSDRVAERRAQRLRVQPRDKLRYGYSLWLDEATGLLLKSELTDAADGRALEIFQFTDITIGDAVRQEDVAPPRKAGSMIDHLELAEQRAVETREAAVRWQAGWLPPGFRMAASDLRNAPATRQRISSLMYSDGIASLSVFVENVGEKRLKGMTSRRGATVTVSRMTHGPNGAGHLVTVVGEVPLPTAQRIAKSVVHR